MSHEAWASGEPDDKNGAELCVSIDVRLGVYLPSRLLQNLIEKPLGTTSRILQVRANFVYRPVAVRALPILLWLRVQTTRPAAHSAFR